MYTIIAGAVVAVALYLLFVRDDATEERVLFTFILGLVGAIVGFTAAVALGAFVPAPDQWRDDGRISLVSMYSNESTSGQLFLGSGTIGPDSYYFFRYPVDQGRATKKGSVRDDGNVRVYEDAEPQKAYLQILVVQNTGFWRHWTIREKTPRAYDFHVPPGSVTKEYEVQ